MCHGPSKTHQRSLQRPTLRGEADYSPPPGGEARVSDTAGRLSKPVGIVLLVILSKEKKVLFLRLKSMSC